MSDDFILDEKFIEEYCLGVSDLVQYIILSGKSVLTEQDSDELQVLLNRAVDDELFSSLIERVDELICPDISEDDVCDILKKLEVTVDENWLKTCLNSIFIDSQRIEIKSAIEAEVRRDADMETEAEVRRDADMETEAEVRRDAEVEIGAEVSEKNKSIFHVSEREDSSFQHRMQISQSSIPLESFYIERRNKYLSESYKRNKMCFRVFLIKSSCFSSLFVSLVIFLSPLIESAKLSVSKCLPIDLNIDNLNSRSVLIKNPCDYDFSQSDMANFNLKGVNLFRLDLEETNLASSNLENANLSNADLKNANLAYAFLKNANLSDAELESAILSDAELENANLSDADLEGADLVSAKLVSADLSDADLESANLQDANLEYADLRRADLEKANLSYADLGHANLSNAELENANLKNTNFREANLKNAILRGVYASDSEYALNNSDEIKKSASSITDLQYADLENADLREAVLIGANLEGADLRNANLEGADLRNANLEGADFENANLLNANVYGANLEKANLKGTSLESYISKREVLMPVDMTRFFVAMIVEVRFSYFLGFWSND